VARQEAQEVELGIERYSCGGGLRQSAGSSHEVGDRSEGSKRYQGSWELSFAHAGKEDVEWANTSDSELPELRASIS
jgi:hypothetical protein